jgi:hypothetical protein
MKEKYQDYQMEYELTDDYGPFFYVAARIKYWLRGK